MFCLILFLFSITSHSQTLFVDSVLTPAEREWLKVNSGKIKYAADPSWAPREFIDDSGNHRGIVADYLSLIEAKLGIDFQRVDYDRWADVIEGLKNEEVDFSGSVHKSKERETYLQITDPFLVSPIGIVVKRMNVDRLSDSDIGSLKLSCPQNYGSLGYIQKIYPNANIVVCDNDFSALMNVVFGETQGAVIDLMTASYLIEKHGLQNLQLIKTLNFNWEIGIGVVKDRPKLYSILEKALKSISQKERAAIYEKWVNMAYLDSPDFFERHQKTLTYAFIFTFILFLTVIAVSVILNRLVTRRTVELNRALKRIAKDKEKYKLLVENQTDLIIKIDPEGRFLFVSSSFCKIFGKSEDELLGQLFVPLVHEKDLNFTWEKIKKIYLAPYYETIEHRVNTAYGKRWFEWTGRGILNKNKEVTEIIAIGRDITEKKEAEAELLKAKERAEESDRLKSAFLANVSHEIRTPMNAIMGFASLIPSEDEKDIINQYSEIIMSNADLLIRIIDDIVLYSRLQTKCIREEATQEFTPGELLDSLRQSFELPEYKKNVKLFIENTTGKQLKIKTDYEKLQQLLMNLTGNAFKYTPAGSIIIGAEQKNGAVIFSVKDTGIGIPKPELEKVFERFFRGSNTHKETIPGTGLGLSIVKELVDLLNGEIWVESEEGQGSAFYVALKR